MLTLSIRHDNDDYIGKPIPILSAFFDFVKENGGELKCFASGSVFDVEDFGVPKKGKIRDVKDGIEELLGVFMNYKKNIYYYSFAWVPPLDHPGAVGDIEDTKMSGSINGMTFMAEGGFDKCELKMNARLEVSSEVNSLSYEELMNGFKYDEIIDMRNEKILRTDEDIFKIFKKRPRSLPELKCLKSILKDLDKYNDDKYVNIILS